MPDDFGRTLAAAAGSAGFSALMVSPLDTLRVRWQVTPTQAPAPGSGAHGGGIVAFGRRLVGMEGVLHGLVLPGLVANVSAIAVCSGVRFALYPTVRDVLSRAAGGADGKKGAVAMTLAGFATGALGYFASAPLWLLKTARQSAPELNGPSPSVRELLAEGGVPRLFRGAAPLVLRGACLSAGNMVGYDGTKTAAIACGVADGPALHLVASVVSAATATALAAPADVTMAFVHTARQRGERFEGVLHCARALLRARGPAGLFRGYTVFLARMAPAFALNLTVYEQARRLLGLGYFA